MTDLDALLAAHPAPAESAISTVTIRPCRRHPWVRLVGDDPAWMCARCGRLRDLITSRRGRSSSRLGKDQERRIERVYGPTKIGERGDPIDHLGRIFKWQSKATRTAPPQWLAKVDAVTPVPGVPGWIGDPIAAMRHIYLDRLPLLIRSHVSHGLRTRDWIIVSAPDWHGLHGGWDPDPGLGYVVMSGTTFLDYHGRDAEIGPTFRVAL